MLKTIFTTVAIVAITTTTAFSQPTGQPRRIIEKEIIDRPEMLTKKLNLTDAQRLQMQKLRIELMKKQTQLRWKVETLRLDIKETFLADKVDRKALESNVKAISDAQGQMKLNFVDHWFAVNSILNADQQKIWKRHAMKMGERMQARAREGIRERIRMRMGGGMGNPEQED